MSDSKKQEFIYSPVVSGMVRFIKIKRPKVNDNLYEYSGSYTLESDTYQNTLNILIEENIKEVSMLVTGRGVYINSISMELFKNDSNKGVDTYMLFFSLSRFSKRRFTVANESEIKYK